MEHVGIETKMNVIAVNNSKLLEDRMFVQYDFAGIDFGDNLAVS
jgi:hypothetical protein